MRRASGRLLTGPQGIANRSRNRVAARVKISPLICTALSSAATKSPSRSHSTNPFLAGRHSRAKPLKHGGKEEAEETWKTGRIHTDLRDLLLTSEVSGCARDVGSPGVSTRSKESAEE